MATSNEEMLLNSKALLWATREVKHLHGVLRLQQPPTCSRVKMSEKLQAFLLKPPATRMTSQGQIKHPASTSTLSDSGKKQIPWENRANHQRSHK